MSIYICTDLEAVASVVDSLNWCYPEGRYYDAVRELLTQETNAAIEGFLAAGAERIVVCDGHGWGGLDPVKLHPRAELLAGSFGYVGYPLGLDSSFDEFAWVGQHAMAGTPHGHFAHTGSFGVKELTFNGRPIGDGPAGPWKGEIANVRIYRRALDEGEISTLTPDNSPA